ncbi:hypothetical protein CVT26_004164 [Gymnopilus dilepis]|uniref:Uncharacterized protein n=1 Tax=Gymnopilus dilepis TaxID=231916 RepID=A0A409WN54_9AGAR|nr:hypothetical protein CVT26_004164 [Gymnopilus dilepis]
MSRSMFSRDVQAFQRSHNRRMRWFVNSTHGSEELASPPLCSPNVPVVWDMWNLFICNISYAEALRRPSVAVAVPRKDHIAVPSATHDCLNGFVPARFGWIYGDEYSPVPNHGASKYRERCNSVADVAVLEEMRYVKVVDMDPSIWCQPYWHDLSGYSE